MQKLRFSRIIPALITGLILTNCTHDVIGVKDYVSLVDPFIGTTGSGNTFLGSSVPYGMVKLGPWIHYTGNNTGGTIYGFSHVHISGMAGGGSSVPGKIIFMPIVYKNNGMEHTFQSHFSHKNEQASPDYYKVFLDDYGITVELTATTRAGLHKYTFPASHRAGIVMKLGSGTLHIDNNEITGKSNGVYFAARFSKSFHRFEVTDNGKSLEGTTTFHGDKINGIFHFDTRNHGTILLKVGISYVDIEGARKNLEQEIPGWDFNRIRKAARKAWNKELGKIDVKGGTHQQQMIFYTALFHAMMHPNIRMDVDRRYRSSNGKIYKAAGFDNYTNFSLWDTFRALHPLFTIINTKRTVQFIRTFLARYDHTGRMLIMEFNSTEGKQPPMIAYHSLSVIADAYVKGIRDYDVPKAYEAMKKLANDLHRKGKKLYLEYGYIPCDLKGQSVSRTLEYSYDDWCITRLAKDFKDDSALIYFGQRGDFYKNLFDTTVNFMRGKKRNFEFVSPFDPMKTVSHYTEANAYQYTTFVPQAMDGLIKLMGGDKVFEAWLDTCFTKKTDLSKINVRDVTGLIGQYAHGNEPSHHMAYLYDYAGAPWKTQALVRQILTTLYTTKQNGIAGNEDCGQMSAWYVMSAMGFYAVTPGLDYYVIGSPLFSKVTINLENGKKFEIIGKNNGTKNMYIQSATLNGHAYSRTYLKHKDIMNGGTLVFVMGNKPNTSWGVSRADRPYFPVKKFHWLDAPTLHFEDIYFHEKMPVNISSANPEAKIFYTLDGTVPTEKSKLYTGTILIDKASVLGIRNYAKGILPGYPLKIHFIPIQTMEAVRVTGLAPGLKYHFVDQPVESAARVMDYPVSDSGIIETFNVNAVKDQRPFGYWFEGYLKVPETGIYTFSLIVNDGAILFINGKEIINNDGGHRSNKMDIKIILNKGWHPILVKYFQMGLAKNLVVSWQGPHFPEQEIPAESLYHKLPGKPGHRDP